MYENRALPLKYGQESSLLECATIDHPERRLGNWQEWLSEFLFARHEKFMAVNELLSEHCKDPYYLVGGTVYKNLFRLSRGLPPETRKDLDFYISDEDSDRVSKHLPKGGQDINAFGNTVFNSVRTGSVDLITHSTFF